jgi:hypothetical protein
MRRLAYLALMLSIASACIAAKEESVAELKSHVETARPEDRPDLFIRIAQHQLRNADQFFIDGKVSDANAAIDDIVGYSEKARDAAEQTNKHLKNIEIDVRKIADKLRDVKRTLAFEDQAPVEQAVHQLEDVRTSLLKAMFAKEKKDEKKEHKK